MRDRKRVMTAVTGGGAMSKHAVVMLGLLAIAVPSRAATSPAARCSGSKLKATAVAARAYARCWADAAVRSRGFLSPECANDALDPLADRFARSEAAGGCATSGDQADIRSIVEQAVLDAAAFVDYQAGSELCTSRKLRAVGTKLFAILRAHASAVRTGNPDRLTNAVVRAETRFAKAFDEAEGAGPCANGAATATAVEDRLDAPIARLRAELAPVCGDDVTAGPEACDGADAQMCPDRCLTDCTCRPIVCGDGLREGGEACDGADAAACPGACQSDCRCPSTCGDGVVNGFEQCDGAAASACGSYACQGPGLLGECQCCSTGYCSGGFPNTCCGASVRCVRNAQSPVGVCTPYGCTQASDCGIGGYNCENGSCCAQPERSCINIGCCAGSTCTSASGVPLCCIPTGGACTSPHPAGICCSGSCNATGVCD
jgi:hypothetical protein